MYFENFKAAIIILSTFYEKKSENAKITKINYIFKKFFKKGNLSSVEIAEPDKLSLLTPTKTYVKSRSDVVELVFPSPSSITSTPQKNKISKLIDMPSPSLKRKINYETDNDSPRKIKLKQSIKHKSKIVIKIVIFLN